MTELFSMGAFILSQGTRLTERRIDRIWQQQLALTVFGAGYK